jgi:hypothetical protein
MNRIIICLLVLNLGFIFSCRRPPAGIDYDYLDKDQLEVLEIDFSYFQTKAKIQYQDDKNNISATANIRIKKDSLIWFSITPALGIEAARGLVTKDSIFLMNRLNKEYVVHDFVSLSQRFNFELDFNLLQAMLLGNMPIEKTPDALVSRDQNFYLVKQAEGNVSADNFISARTMKVEKVQMVQEPEGNALTMQYSNFNMVDNYALPFSSIFSLVYKSEGNLVNTHLSIDYSRAEIIDTPLSFPFSIPSKYERK